MKIIVTGGAGFIGSHIVDALLSRGHSVLVVDDLSSGRERNLNTAARFERVDIRDATRVRDIVREFRPTGICHQAAQTSVSVSVREARDDAERNVVGSINVLEAAVAEGVEHITFASTGGAIYGEVPEGVLAEVGMTERPLSPYACAKLSVERYLGYYAFQYGIGTTVLRYANVYGPRQDPHGEAGVVAIFAKRMLKSQGIQINAKCERGDDGCIRDYVYVDDVVRANVLAVENRVSGTFNLATGIARTTRDIADALATELKMTPAMSFGDKRPGDLERSVLQPYLGFGTPTDFTTGIAATAAFFAKHNDD